MKILKLWGPVIFWAGMIFYFSNQPRIGSGLEEVEAGLVDLALRKCVHVFEYFMLNILFYRALKGSFKLDPKKLFLCSVVFSVIYALLDEYHQSFVPSRTSSIYDVMIDSIGIVGSYILIRFWR